MPWEFHRFISESDQSIHRIPLPKCSGWKSPEAFDFQADRAGDSSFKSGFSQPASCLLSFHLSSQVVQPRSSPTINILFKCIQTIDLKFQPQNTSLQTCTRMQIANDLRTSNLCSIAKFVFVSPARGIDTAKFLPSH